MIMTAAAPIIGNLYVLIWSVINFLLLILIVAVPIICILMLIKMNRRLQQIEAEMQKLIESNESEEG